jgi:signal transduction histidine kinase
MGDVFTGHIVIRACSARSSLRKLNDDLDVIRLSLKGLRECFQWFKASDEAREPPTVCACKYFSRLVPMPLVGVDAVDHHAVLEHSRARDISRRGAKCGPAACSSGRTCFARLKAAQLALSVRKMNLDARYGSVTATFVLALVAFCTSLDALAAEPQRVLLLHSFGREFAPYDAVVAAFRTELAQGASAPIVVNDESLDAEQAFGSDDQELILELLRRRFGGLRPDVVVTIGPPAAALYLQDRDKLFPAARLVIAALDERLVRKSALRAGDMVVAIHQDLFRLVDNILRVLPETQTIAIVLGATPLERFWTSEARRELAGFAGGITFEWLNDLPLAQMRQRVATLPPHSAVLYGLLVQDAAGVPYERGAALESLVAVSAAPIFSLYESELGHGVVGGPYHSQQRVGALTAAATLRALRGEIPAEPAIQLVDYEPPVYDWRELKRWGIDRARLPPGSEVRFQPPSFWHEHRALILTTTSIFLLQTALLIGLLWQRLRRRRAEGEALALSGRLISAHEDERRWLARELHDDITQRLAGLAIDAAELDGGDLSPRDREGRRSMRGGLVQLSQDVHSLSYRLHPSVIEDLGLVEALRTECDRIARAESLQVDLQADILPAGVSREVALCIYRVAQEALRNIGRHAKATTVRLSLALRNGGLGLTVSDNGSGFEPAAQNHHPSLGHASMRERVRSLDGKLDIRSAPGQGTTVIAWVPVREARP